LANNTRWRRKPQTYGSIQEAIRETARFYRQALWRDLEVYVGVWLEKEALAGVLVEVTDEYDVPLMVTRGLAELPACRSRKDCGSGQARVHLLLRRSLIPRARMELSGEQSHGGGCGPRSGESSKIWKRTRRRPRRDNRL
jgi:hypothetical protein